MNNEQQNSLLGYIASRLEGQENILSSKLLNLLISYSLLVRLNNCGIIQTDTFVSISLKLIECFKKDPITLSLILEYKKLND